MAKSVQVWLSDEANNIINDFLDKANEGRSTRRGDKFLTKAEHVSDLIDLQLKLTEITEDGK